MTRSDFDAAQIARDAKITRQLQVNLQAEVERERQREEKASKVAIAETYDEVQAGIDVDELFAAKLQHEEREEYTIEERAKVLAETIAAQRKFRAAQRSAEIRSRLPTKSQLRNLMMTYLKNIVLRFEMSKKDDEVSIREKDQAEDLKIKQQRSLKRQFDRLDLVELYNLVMKRFETTPEGVDLVLWGDLRTMFDANTEDELWHNQERWNLKSWDLYENCGVHTLILEDGTEIHMLVERKLISMEAMMEVRRIFKCWFHYHTINGHQFTMSNRHQELASPKQTASGKDFSNLLMADSLPKTIWFSTHHALQ
ncbi:hypothetical protein Tco_0006241 [Tanacetum coccineum]